ncbi:hypothetical protein, partial [Micromonospora sp. NPDC049799]|uniref:hypothetical protein n=1 Tax=Micromonospora sp. NPDC049799 TaxID=3154741 RepID=UPI0033D70ECF
MDGAGGGDRRDEHRVPGFRHVEQALGPQPGQRREPAVDASRATCGGTSIMQMSWTSMRRSARALETA